MEAMSGVYCLKVLDPHGHVVFHAHDRCQFDGVLWTKTQGKHHVDLIVGLWFWVSIFISTI